MATSEAQRQQIIDFTGSMSVREIAEHVGVSKDAVYRVQKSLRNGPSAVALSVAESAEIPASARARDKIQTVAVSRDKTATNRDTSATPESPSIGRSGIVSVMIGQLMSELDLYEKAKLSAMVDPQAKWEVVQHQKLVQSALNALAKWCGLDKGTMPGTDDTVEDVTETSIVSMSLDEMLLIAKKL